MRRALALARRGFGRTSPNPMVGALLVRDGHVLGEGWHRRAGEPHAEIAALRDASRRGEDVRGATLYVTLEPCSSRGRTPACTDALLTAGLHRIVVAAVDPNPRHRGRAFAMLRRAALRIDQGLLEAESNAMNEAFNHWIVHRTPFVTVKAAMTLDGKIATARRESKWITGQPARTVAMRLRRRADAILVGVNTIIADDPSLTIRPADPGRRKPLRRIVLDAHARTPLEAQVISDTLASATTVVVSAKAPARRVRALASRVRVWTAPRRGGRMDLRWLLRKLGGEEVSALLVEGGGEVNASFLLNGLAQRIAFFYAPKIIGGGNAIKAVAGPGLLRKQDWLRLRQVQWQLAGKDLFLTARVD